MTPVEQALINFVNAALDAKLPFSEIIRKVRYSVVIIASQRHSSRIGRHAARRDAMSKHYEGNCSQAGRDLKIHRNTVSRITAQKGKRDYV